MRRALLLLVVAGTAHADPKTAAAGAAAAEQLVSAGRFAEACPLLEQSYHDDPQLSVLLELADCHEHVDRLATAWRELVEARELAHRLADPREDFARQRADEMQTRVGYLHVDPPSPDIPGLACKRDELEQRLGHDIAVDAGTHHLVATAPGRQTWDTTTTVVDGQTTHLAMPQLGETPSVTTFGGPGAPGGSLGFVPGPEHAHKSATARVLALGGLGVLAIGGGFGVYAIVLGNEASDPKNCDGTVCNAHGTSLASSARNYARFADVALGAGLVMETIALVVASSDQPQLKFVPAVTQTGASVTYRTRF